MGRRLFGLGPWSVSCLDAEEGRPATIGGIRVAMTASGNEGRTEPVATSPRTGGDRRRFLSIFGLLGLASAALAALLWPMALGFDLFAFGDPGNTLIVESLQDRGFRPNVDFCHPYGLLVLAVGRLWFRTFGATPLAYRGLMAVLNVLVLWGLARFLAAIRAGAVGLSLVLLSLLYVAPATEPGPVYGLEKVFLIHALAEHARGRRSAALAFCTADLFVKQTMAYIYGLALVLAIAADLVRRRERSAAAWLRPLLPAAAVGLAMFIACIALYGLTPTLDSYLFPFVKGGQHYRLEGYGFFGPYGRNFYAPAGAKIGYYLGTIAGFWIAGSLVLLLATVAALLTRPTPTTSDDPRISNELVLSCGAMQLAFIFVFFAHTWSWKYYLFALVLGLVATGRRFPKLVPILGGLVAMLALMLGRTLAGEVAHESQLTRGPETHGLWIRPDDRVAFEKLRKATVGTRPVVLDYCGGLPILFPDLFQPPTTLWMVRGCALPTEVERLRAEVRSAEVVVVINAQDGRPPFLQYWPELASDLAGWSRVVTSSRLQAFRNPRVSSPGLANFADSPQH